MSLAAALRRLLAATDRAAPLGPLLVRLSLFAVFAPSGWGKLHDVPRVVEFFTELGIPAPHFHAVLVGTVELVGGVALLLGLGTRLAAIPLAFSMLVAIATAKRDEIGGPLDLLAVTEFVYVTGLAWLAVAGAGTLSLDALLPRLVPALDPGRASARPRAIAP